MIAAALIALDVAGVPRIRDPFMSLVDLLPGWLVDAGYEAIARDLHLALGAAAALMLAAAAAMVVILRNCPSPDSNPRRVHFLTARLNATRGPVEASRNAEDTDVLSACERFSVCPHASSRRRRAELPATALRSPAGPA